MAGRGLGGAAGEGGRSGSEGGSLRVSRNKTLTPASSKKAGGLQGCCPAASVFLSVTFRSHGLRVKPQGSWALRSTGSLLPTPWIMLLVGVAAFGGCGVSIFYKKELQPGRQGAWTSARPPPVRCDFEQISSPPRNHTPTIT